MAKALAFTVNQESASSCNSRLRRTSKWHTVHCIRRRFADKCSNRDCHVCYISSCSAHVRTRTLRDTRSLCHARSLCYKGTANSVWAHGSWLLWGLLITDILHATVCNLVQAPTTPTQSSRTGDRPTDLMIQEYLWLPGSIESQLITASNCGIFANHPRCHTQYNRLTFDFKRLVHQ